MMDISTLEIQKVRDGGYVIVEPRDYSRDTAICCVFACDDIDEALKYIRGKLVGVSGCGGPATGFAGSTILSPGAAGEPGSSWR